MSSRMSSAESTRGQIVDVPVVLRISYPCIRMPDHPGSVNGADSITMEQEVNLSHP